MYKAEVEIYSDETNRAVIRHPGRKFPGVLIQGDNLHALCQVADRVCAGGREGMPTESYTELNNLRNTLWSYLSHYKGVLNDHDIRLPFSES